MTIIESAVANLSNLSNKQGYITFDDIMATADTYHLSLTEVDILSEALNDKGILIYESHPDFTDDDFDDYSRTDYEAIFKEVTDINPSLQNLIDSIRKINPPQWGEMSSLAKQAKNGNSYARERMILLYLRNAIKVALSMAKQYNLSIEDAISSAISGLITAVDRFDPNGFSAFNSYASMWMQQNINRDCNPVWFEYYYPVHAKEKIQKVKALYAVLDEGSDDETLGRFQAYTNYSFNEINYYLSQIESQMNKLSIEDIIENEEDETFYELSYKSQINSIDEIDELLDYERMKATLDNILNTLTEKEKKVLSLRFGLEEGMPPMTLEEVGEVFNVTRERIRQIEQKALRKLRHPSRARPLAGYLD